ncbi:hypothetical protein LOTGIDRAFT_156990 [Lottia gigantea]|uniref:TACI cysteine-rich domain-containing protein n=1 Tax=Lottia gigantea TaxID=225164 RepID=V4B664_LOTGI|nr:hypothetical protein LOTGIDRAFT_156990 [Lottia gigantea]ESP03031.1 hypothetical protein LOTGIDRAFT_156990 [Lottia gigantea]
MNIEGLKYHHQTKCPTGEYWEKLFEKCEKCYTMCEQARMRGNVKSCEEACPGYLERYVSETSSISSSIATTSLYAIQKVSDNAVSSVIWIVVAFFGGIIVVVLILVALRQYLKKKRGKESHSISYHHGAHVEDKPPCSGIQESQPPSSAHPQEESLLP